MLGDVLVLHIMYSIGVSSETIALLTFDSIGTSDKTIYFNTLKLK